MVKLLAGMVMAAKTAQNLGQFTQAETQRVIQLLKKQIFPSMAPMRCNTEDYFTPHMMQR